MGLEHDRPLRVAYTLEQCWHEVPGGTATAAIAIGAELAQRPDIELIGVAGRHRNDPGPPWVPPVPVRRLALARPWLYETWLRLGWPAVERATGSVDVCHATALIPAPTSGPLVVTVHDLAFRRWPDRFTRHGVAVMERALARLSRCADVVLSPSDVTTTDLIDAGIDAERIAAVPLGVDPMRVGDDEVDRVLEAYRLPEHFVLFVGTREPRKNLRRLIDAVAPLDVDLVVAGAIGWGADATETRSHDARVRYLGFVPDADLAGLYAAAAVLAYPSEWEGFGLPVLEAMAQGTAVVTSRGTSTEEVAGGAAVLVDPSDTDSITAGLVEALDSSRGAALSEAGLARAAEMTWSASAGATVAAYRLAVRSHTERATRGRRR
jgi:glycosyltransferase involved in cell wall biosynthesis